MKTFIVMGLDSKECGKVTRKNAAAALKVAQAAVHEKATIRVARDEDDGAELDELEMPKTADQE